MGSGLDPNVKEFIRRKILHLGSIEAVNRFYSASSAVDEYARCIAYEIFLSNNNELTRDNHKERMVVTHPSKRNDQKGRTFPEISSEEKSKLDREAFLAALQRKRERDNQSGGIPEYEEGSPRTEWGSREDYKKMRARDWGDMKRRQKG